MSGLEQQGQQPEQGQQVPKTPEEIKAETQAIIDEHLATIQAMNGTEEEKNAYIAGLQELTDPTAIQAYMDKMRSEQDRLSILKESITNILITRQDISQTIKTAITQLNDGEKIRSILSLISKKDTPFTAENIQTILDTPPSTTPATQESASSANPETPSTSPSTNTETRNSTLQPLRDTILGKLSSSQLTEQEKAYITTSINSCNNRSILQALQEKSPTEIYLEIQKQRISINTLAESWTLAEQGTLARINNYLLNQLD